MSDKLDSILTGICFAFFSAMILLIAALLEG